MGGASARRTVGRRRPSTWAATGPLPEAALTHGTRLTFDEYCRTPETNLKRELFFGAVREGATLVRHQGVVVQLVVAFELFNRARLRGFVGVAPGDVVLDQERDLVLQPDVFVIGPDRLPLVGAKFHGAPDIVVEVTSPSRRRYDRVQKRTVYREYGVKEYWIADPLARTVEVIAWEGERRDEVTDVFRGGDTARSRLWPALAVPLDEVWGPLAR